MADTSRIQQLFDSELVVVNVGPELFADALREQGVEVLQVDWRPTAGGNKKMQELLDLLGGF